MTSMKLSLRALRAALAGASLISVATLAAVSLSDPALAPFFDLVSDGPARPDEDGFIRRWMLLEPIAKPNRSNAGFTGSYVRKTLTETYFPGQFTGLPRAGEKVTVAKTPLAWHALDSKTFDIKLFNFAQALGKTKYGVIFYAVTVVDSPSKRANVRLAVGSNSASLWWVNGQETAALFNDRRMVMDDVVSPRVTLKKGRNLIWGAVINGPGLSNFCVRFIDENSKPITNLAVSSR